MSLQPSDKGSSARRRRWLTPGLYLLAAILLLAFVLTIQPHGPRQMAEREDPRSYLESLIAESKVPGIQYLMVGPDGVLFEYAAGRANISQARPMNQDTTLMAYSMSKTITAAAVMRLADENKLSLDDSVSSYVDSFPYGTDVSIGQLLTHTSGIPAPVPLRWAHLVTEHDSFDEESALSDQLQKYNTLASRPGERYTYSNLGYWLLGPVIESASGTDFEIYVSEQVLKPLGASASELGYVIPDPAVHATGYLEAFSFLNLIKGFVIDRELIGNYDGRWLQINPHYVNGPAFGGLVGTARGFGKFLQDQLQPSSVLFSEQMQKTFYEAVHTSDGREIPMTAGWHIGNLDENRYFYKEGGGGGFRSMMRIYRDQGIGSVLLANATAYDVGGLQNVLDAQFLQ